MACIVYSYTYSINVHIASKGIELHGTEAQRARWLPRLPSGRAFGFFARTEDAAGSDAAALQTTAIRHGDCYMLNGAKRSITNAPLADLTIFAAYPDGGARAKISTFVVDPGVPGLRVGKVIPMRPWRRSFGDRLRDPVRAAEKSPRSEGEGFAIAMQRLDAGRIN